jgi:UDP-N-acetylmuramoyl-tripeptide--D-alanyl-D-alanine ligase
MLASQIAAATRGRLVGPDAWVDGASFDSRSLRPGELFVPLVAERDGHEFIGAAVEAGAGAYLTGAYLSRHPAPGPAESVVPAIVVDDTAAALLDLARHARSLLDVPVIGVTGSVGKTTTKDFTAAALAATRRVTANERSFNNEQGLPVTVLGAPDGVEALVVEMGMRGFGQIRRLCDVASPTIGVVTAVAAAHTAMVGGIEGVATAKRELVEALPRSGTAVLNAEDHRVAAMASATAAAVVTFGRGGDVRPDRVEFDDLARARFTAESPWGRVEVRLAVSGAHMVTNALAALAVTGVVEGRIDSAARALESASVSAMRMQVERTAAGAVVVDDAYNANPTSAGAALRAVAAMAGRRRVAVLGAMAELDDPVSGHLEVRSVAESLGIEFVAYDTDLYGVEPVRTVGELVDRLGLLGDGDVVLVKASRAAGLEIVVEALVGRA